MVVLLFRKYYRRGVRVLDVRDEIALETTHEDTDLFFVRKDVAVDPA